MKPSVRRKWKATPGMDWMIELAEKPKASVRAKVYHPFRVIKRQFGCLKVRYRGLMNNTAQLTTLFALAPQCTTARAQPDVQFRERTETRLAGFDPDAPAAVRHILLDDTLLPEATLQNSASNR
jgi:hypothetical protein